MGLSGAFLVGATALGSTLAASQTGALSSCRNQGECPAGRGTAPSGFTNNTGWAQDGSHCCDICAVNGTQRVNCFDKATCGSKTGDNDWDFVVFDQIWLPQLCSALSQGHDPTLTHMQGTTCRNSAKRTSGLSIHGLWPNYIGGFPQCCRHVTLPEQLPMDLLEQADQEWVDPTTQAGDACGFCSMWAHEMMKHGSCFAADMAGYSNVSLGLLRRLERQTSKVNSILSASASFPALTSELIGAFKPYAVQMLCDPRDNRSTESTGVFLELRTCWNKTENFSPAAATATELFQIDCPGKAIGAECPEFVISSGFHVEHSMGQLWT